MDRRASEHLLQKRISVAPAAGTGPPAGPGVMFVVGLRWRTRRQAGLRREPAPRFTSFPRGRDSTRRRSGPADSWPQLRLRFTASGSSRSTSSTKLARGAVSLEAPPGHANENHRRCCARPSRDRPLPRSVPRSSGKKSPPSPRWAAQLLRRTAASAPSPIRRSRQRRPTKASRRSAERGALYKVNATPSSGLTTWLGRSSALFCCNVNQHRAGIGPHYRAFLADFRPAVSERFDKKRRDPAFWKKKRLGRSAPPVFEPAACVRLPVPRG